MFIGACPPVSCFSGGTVHDNISGTVIKDNHLSGNGFHPGAGNNETGGISIYDASGGTVIENDANGNGAPATKSSMLAVTLTPPSTSTGTITLHIGIQNGGDYYYTYTAGSTSGGAAPPPVLGSHSPAPVCRSPLVPFRPPVPSRRMESVPPAATCTASVVAAGIG